MSVLVGRREVAQTGYDFAFWPISETPDCIRSGRWSVGNRT